MLRARPTHLCTSAKSVSDRCGWAQFSRNVFQGGIPFVSLTFIVFLIVNSRKLYNVTDMYAVEGDVSSKYKDTQGLELLNQIKLPGLRPSMSVGDLVNHIGDCISEQMRSDHPNLSIDETQKWEILEDITQYLLNDSQTLTSSDEKSIMSRVNSLCCLLQKEDTGVQHARFSSENVPDPAAGSIQEDMNPANQLCGKRTAKSVYATGTEIGLSNDSQQGTSMSRKDSIDELLLHLPRIASLPQFLVPEDLGNQGR